MHSLSFNDGFKSIINGKISYGQLARTAPIGIGFGVLANKVSGSLSSFSSANFSSYFRQHPLLGQNQNFVTISTLISSKTIRVMGITADPTIGVMEETLENREGDGF